MNNDPHTAEPPDGDGPEIIEQVDANQLPHFVTTLKSAEQQIGENIISALQHDDTVAVLTTVIMGPDGNQRIVSAALNPRLMSQVQEMLAKAQEEREDEELCIGFHCLVKPKVSDDSHAPEREDKENNPTSHTQDPKSK